MRRRTFIALSAGSLGTLLAAGCSEVSPNQPGSSKETKKGPFTIGVSNAFVGSEYRTQMIDDIKAAFEEYQKEGIVGSLVLENADADVNGQIQQVRNLINKGVHAIIINPNSATALDAVFKEAEGQGISVYAIDQAVETKSVLNVGIDQGAWAAESAKWLAGKVGKGGKIVAVNGISGHPANEARWSAAKKVFDEAGVEVLTVADGGWDQAKGQQAMTNLIATYPDIQGVWTQDGMAQGCLKAVEAAGKTDSIVVTGEARNGFMRMWNDLKAKGFESVGVVNPPGTGATALHFAVAQLQGKKLDPSKITGEHNIVLPLEPAITNAIFDDAWKKVSDKPDSFVMDSVLSRSDVAKYFV
ncbi:MAG: substrate-binding domain-containing protein [Propionibacteriaceae bacterium]|nr:substrate-binding domain-containing protein [Propionibacteriaceae bacterium]